MAEKTEAQKRAQRNYMKSKATIQLVISPERRDLIRDYADAVGESVNAYINKAVDERMEREGGARPAEGGST